MLLILILSVLAISLCNPIVTNEGKQEDDALGYAVDFGVTVTQSQFKCLSGNGYPLAWIMAYDFSIGFQKNSITNINNAYAANVATEVFMIPYPFEHHTGAEQLTDTYNGLVKGGIKVQKLWLQVFNVWNEDHNYDIQFIQSYIDQLKVLGISGGIYTDKKDWTYITNNWTGASSLPLWYSHANGAGISRESQPNYDDFEPFGGCTTPIAKQFALYETACGIGKDNLNRNVFTLPHSAQVVLTKEEGPVVGNTLF